MRKERKRGGDSTRGMSRLCSARVRNVIHTPLAFRRVPLHSARAAAFCRGARRSSADPPPLIVPPSLSNLRHHTYPFPPFRTNCSRSPPRAPEYRRDRGRGGPRWKWSAATPPSWDSGAHYIPAWRARNERSTEREEDAPRCRSPARVVWHAIHEIRFGGAFGVSLSLRNPVDLVISG